MSQSTNCTKCDMTREMHSGNLMLCPVYACYTPAPPPSPDTAPKDVTCGCGQSVREITRGYRLDKTQHWTLRETCEMCRIERIERRAASPAGAAPHAD